MKLFSMNLSCSCLGPKSKSTFEPLVVPVTKLDLPGHPSQPLVVPDEPLEPPNPEEPSQPTLPLQPVLPVSPVYPGHPEQPDESQEDDDESDKSDSIEIEGTPSAHETAVCFVPVTAERPITQGIAPERENAVMLSSKLWVNHTVIKYYLDTNTNVPRVNIWDMQEAVRSGFGEWKSLGLGLDFKEVKDARDAEIRVSFQAGGSWSYVGTDNIDENTIRYPSPTMNFGWDVTIQGRSFDTALHEIGHALGLSHEHQNPFGGLQWDESAVLKHYSGYPNYWNEKTTRWNILRKVAPRDVTANTWDRKSIMHYPLSPGLVYAPDNIRRYGMQRAGGLSDGDKAWMRKTYPPKRARVEERIPLAAYRSSVLDFSTGGQKDYVIEPPTTREYRMGTFGWVDTKVVLFELNERTGEPMFLAGDDDSGHNRNAQINMRLHSGKKYVLRVRMVYGFENIASVMYF